MHVDVFKCTTKLLSSFVTTEYHLFTVFLKTETQSMHLPAVMSSGWCGQVPKAKAESTPSLRLSLPLPSPVKQRRFFCRRRWLSPPIIHGSGVQKICGSSQSSAWLAAARKTESSHHSFALHGHPSPRLLGGSSQGRLKRCRASVKEGPQQGQFR